MTDSDPNPTDVPDEGLPQPSRDHFQDGTFNDWLDLSLESFDDGEVVLSVVLEDAKRNTGGTLHGGVTASLIDVTAGMTIASSFEDDPPSMATTSLDVDYLRPITEEAFATGEVVRVGGTTAVARVDVQSTTPEGGQKLAAIGTVTFQRA